MIDRMALLQEVEEQLTDCDANMPEPHSGNTFLRALVELLEQANQLFYSPDRLRPCLLRIAVVALAAVEYLDKRK